jgi:hypothetical protein
LRHNAATAAKYSEEVFMETSALLETQRARSTVSDDSGNTSAAVESLVLAALKKALSSPEPLSLIASGRNPGLFPRTRLGQQAAELCQQRGWLECVASRPAGKTVTALYTLTEAGLQWLLHKTDPATALEALQQRIVQGQQQWQTWGEMLERCREELDQLRQWVAGVIEELKTSARQGWAAGNPAILKATAWPFLRRWQETHPQEDCPLPELFRQLRQQHPQLNVGQFQEALRQWYGQGQIVLHPWAGPIYEIPEPELAMLVGHAIAYYVSLRASGNNAPAGNGCL